MNIKNDTDSAVAIIKLVFEKIFAFRFIYAISLVVFLGLAFLFNKFTPRIYQMSATIGPVEDKRTSALASNEMFRGYESSYSTGRGIEDAINSLSSFSLISKTVNDLKLEVGYFVDTNMFRIPTEVFMQSPFIVTIDKSHTQTINSKFYITILSDSSYRIEISESKAVLYNYLDNDIVAEKVRVNFDTVFYFNQALNTNIFKFSLSPNKEFFNLNIIKNHKFHFELYNPEELAKAYLKSLKINPVSYLASIIEVQFSSSNLDKSLKFLNSYINGFLEENLAKKNKIAVSTINFIDTQISEMSDSLIQSESKLRNYQSSNQVMDLSFQGQKIYEQLSQVETDKAALEAQNRYYNYVLNYFRNNQDISGVSPPSSANINDPIMNKLITDMIALNAERSSIANNSNEKNLFLQQIDSKLKTQRQTIIENIKNNINTITLNLNELNYKGEKLSNAISNLPKQEMGMVNIQRKFNLNNTIYTYLLQKRSEAAITLASNYPDYEVLEPARRITSEKIKPKTLFNYFVAVFFALLLPTIVLVIKFLLNDKITMVSDVESILHKKVFSVIYNNPTKTEAVVMEYPRSAIAESFRNLRSSIFMKLKDKKVRTILLSSSQPEDGKSFISFNLAASIASVGIRTVIVDFDFRRPVLHNKFGDKNETGISNYIMNIASLEQIIHKSPWENLDYITAGPILPNPSELIQSGVLDEFVQILKDRYDFVIIDSPPIGIVSDTLQVMKYADHILIVSRLNYTKKDIFAGAVSSLESSNFKNYDVILNGYNIDKSPYSSYKDYYIKE